MIISSLSGWRAGLAAQRLSPWQANDSSWVVCGAAAGEYYVLSQAEFEAAYIVNSATAIGAAGGTPDQPNTFLYKRPIVTNQARAFRNCAPSSSKCRRPTNRWRWRLAQRGGRTGECHAEGAQTSCSWIQRILEQAHGGHRVSVSQAQQV